jgi:hypothetical protein
MLPRFPLYIPTKGRADSRLTAKALAKMGVPYRLVVEQQDWDAYVKHEPASNLLVLDPEYQRKYETLDSVGDAKPKGSGPARNFIWDHSISEGHAFHWIMDDNIRWFGRMYRNKRVRVETGACFRAMEDFVLRYDNIAMAGPAYAMFAFCEHQERLPPFVLNTRLFSCNLIRNDVAHRWRGRFNEDAILSIDMLKAGWCTVQFNAFVQAKLRTMTMKGGNTDSIYTEGTLPKSRMLVATHPDIATLKYKFKRWHHHVNYRVFKQQLRLKPGYEPKPGRDEYGMQLVERAR